MKKGIPGILTSTLTSGGVVGYGSAGGYVSEVARRQVGLQLSALKDGRVIYLAKNQYILKRAVRQRASQLAYGILNSSSRYIKYWEQKELKKRVEASDTSRANEKGQYAKLIEEQKAIAGKGRIYKDQIVENLVYDFLELRISEDGVYYDGGSQQIEPNSTYGLVSFVDLQPKVQVTTRNNIILTSVQGRDYSRKEFVSGGDLEVSISGLITSRYPDVYPEAEVSRFLRLMQYKGILECSNTILRQFHISRLIVLGYGLGHPDCRNVQPYTLTCVAVEPSEMVTVKSEVQADVEKKLVFANKWLDVVRFGTRVVDPTSILKLTRLWI